MKKINDLLIKAVQLHQQNRLNDAEKKYKKVLVLNSNEPTALRHLGMIYHTRGLFEKSLNFFYKALEQSKTKPDCYNNIGSVYFDQGQDALAEEWFNKSLYVNDKYIPALNNIAQLYAKKLDKENALIFAEKAKNIQPSNPFSINAYGLALLINNRVDDSIQVLENLIVSHESADAYSNLGAAYRDKGDLKKSFKNYEKAYSLKPLDGQIFRNLSHSKFYDPSIDEIKELESYFIKITNDEQKAMYSFGLHNVYEKNNDYEKSFFYLDKANLILDTQTQFDLDKEVIFFDKIKKIFINKSKENKTQKDIKKKIFIVGMPRSGTTLVEQILASHSKVYGCGELDYLTKATSFNTLSNQGNENDKILESYIHDDNLQIFEKIKDKYNSSIQKLEIKENIITDKMPHNFVLIGFIKNTFPQAKIVYCDRDPLDTCLSLYKRTFVHKYFHSYVYDQKKLGEYYLLHKKLMDFWINLYGSSIYQIKYEDLIDDQEKNTRDLLAYCDLEWEDQCMEFYKSKRNVKTASNEQVRQPIYKDSLKSWKKYDTKLDDLKKALNYNE